MDCKAHSTFHLIYTLLLVLVITELPICSSTRSALRTRFYHRPNHHPSSPPAVSRGAKFKIETEDQCRVSTVNVRSIVYSEPLHLISSQAPNHLDFWCDQTARAFLPTTKTLRSNSLHVLVLL